MFLSRISAGQLVVSYDAFGAVENKCIGSFGTFELDLLRDGSVKVEGLVGPSPSEAGGLCGRVERKKEGVSLLRPQRVCN